MHHNSLAGQELTCMRPLLQRFPLVYFPPSACLGLRRAPPTPHPPACGRSLAVSLAPIWVPLSTQKSGPEVRLFLICVIALRDHCDCSAQANLHACPTTHTPPCTDSPSACGPDNCAWNVTTHHHDIMRVCWVASVCSDAMCFQNASHEAHQRGYSCDTPRPPA